MTRILSGDAADPAPAPSSGREPDHPRALDPEAGERERSVARTFVGISERLVDGIDDAVDIFAGLTADCAALLDIASVGLLLADKQGAALQLTAASCERVRELQLFELGIGQGPCLDCYRSGVAVIVPDLSRADGRWPRFVAGAAVAGFTSVHAVPLLCRNNVLGSLGLFGTGVGYLNAEDLALAHALAQVAAATLVALRTLADKSVLADQLQGALSSRVVLEQAKGILAHAGHLGIDAAFAALRCYSRDHNQRLSDLARQVVARELPAQALLDHGHAKGMSAMRPPRRGSRSIGREINASRGGVDVAAPAGSGDVDVAVEGGAGDGR